jgi:hypothetical protein
MIRRLLCVVGLHRWQLLYEPPGMKPGESGRYRKGIWCVFCGRESRHAPGGRP